VKRGERDNGEGVRRRISGHRHEIRAMKNKFARTLIAYFRVDISDGRGRKDDAKRLNFVNENALINSVYRSFFRYKKYSCKSNIE